jgi:hypothetical protein
MLRKDDPLVRLFFKKSKSKKSNFQKKISFAKQNRFQSLQKNKVNLKPKHDFDLNEFNLKRNESKKKLSDSAFHNVYGIEDNKQNDCINRKKNKYLEMLFKTYKVSKTEKKVFYTNSSGINKQINSLIDSGDQQFREAEEFIKKNILQSNPILQLIVLFIFIFIFIFHLNLI